MKNILFLLILSTNAYSQSNVNNQTTSVDISGSKSAIELANTAAKEQGFYTLGNGQYKVVKVGGSGFVKLSTLKKRAEEQMQIFSNNNRLTYKVLNIEEQKQSIGVFPKVTITYQLFDSTGNVYMTKEDKEKSRDAIISELKKLKELLDLGIITQDEFDKKAALLKKSILDN
jgi:hypothetical protein